MSGTNPAVSQVAFHHCRRCRLRFSSASHAAFSRFTGVAPASPFGGHVKHMVLRALLMDAD